MNDRNGFPKLTQLILDGIDLDVFDDRLGQIMLRNWQLGVCDGDIAGMIQNRVDKEKLRRAFRRIPFEPPQLTQGEIIEGFTIES